MTTTMKRYEVIRDYGGHVEDARMAVPMTVDKLEACDVSVTGDGSLVFRDSTQYVVRAYAQGTWKELRRL